MVRDGWGLDPDVLFLNHGSFGACPTVVLQEQARLRAHLEREPVRFFVRELEGRLDEARRALAEFIGAAPEDLAWVPNATVGVNAVLRSLSLDPGDELITTEHAYNACRNALEFVAGARGARVVVAEVGFPVAAPEAVAAAVLAAVGPRTRLALLDHVTSPTGLVLPVAQLVAALRSRGVETLVDGAHAPGMLPLDVTAIDADYYTGNCHKWICAPKGAGFLVVRRELQPRIRPVAISHGANTPRADRTRFLVEFDWTGTGDPTAILCVPAALRAMAARVPGGWPSLMARNRALALTGRRILCEALGVAPPCPDEMIGSLASVPLPDGAPGAATTPLYADPLGDALLFRHGIEVPVVPWPAPGTVGARPGRRLVRISAQLYNEPADYQQLATALLTELPR